MNGVYLRLLVWDQRMSIIYNPKTRLFETDFVNGNGWYLELALENGIPSLVKYEIKTQEITSRQWFKLQGRQFVPPGEDELTRHVRIPKYYTKSDVSVSSLLRLIDEYLFSCLDVDAGHRFLLACFVLSTWVVDRLPIAPILSIVGPPQSGKTTVLKALYLLCRRGLLTSDIASAAFNRTCDRLIPTVLIDNTATARQERKLIHLLRSGNTPSIADSGGSQSYGTYGAKVVSWTELPDDDALNSRCIIIPMQQNSRMDLLRTTDSRILSLAYKLEAQLQTYRWQKYGTLQMPQILGAESLRSRDRDLYEALALPISEDPEACARLMECMEKQHDLHSQSLPPKHAAVLGTLFHQIHLHPEQGTLTIRRLTEEVNLNLERAGEHFRLTWKAVGAALTSLGLFFARTRTSSGWEGCLDRAARKLVHDLVSRHSMDGFAEYLPSEEPWEPCEFCKAPDSQSPENAPIEESTTELPIESAEHKPGDVLQASAEPEEDLASPLIQPDLGDGESFDETEKDRIEPMVRK